MFRIGFFWRLLLAVLLIGLLAVGGMALFRAGWAQGYQVAVLSPASGEAGVPRLPVYAPYPGYGFMPFFPPFGLFVCFGGFLLLFLLFGSMFAGRRHWAGGPWHGGARYGDWGHGPMPPWVKECKERYEEQSKGSEEAASPQSATPGASPENP
jgi:hypothetical protein